MTHVPKGRTKTRPAVFPVVTSRPAGYGSGFSPVQNGQGACQNETVASTRPLIGPPRPPGQPLIIDSLGQRQENRVTLVGNCGDFGAGPDMASADSRVYSRIRLAQFCGAGHRPRTNTISGYRSPRLSFRRLRDTGLFSPSPVWDCTLLPPRCA